MQVPAKCNLSFYCPFLYYRRCQFNYYMAKGRDSYSPEDLKSCNNCHKSAEKKRSEGNGMEVKK